MLVNNLCTKPVCVCVCVCVCEHRYVDCIIDDLFPDI